MLMTSYLFKKALDAAIEAAKKKLTEKTLKENETKLNVTVSDLEESIQHHLQLVKNWSQEVTFNDLKRPRLTSDIFVQLDISVFPTRMRASPTEKIEQIPLRRMLDHDPHHIILLGQPGAGKTTSIKFICQAMLRSEKTYAGGYSFPLLIRLRDLNGFDASPDSTVLLDRILSILGLKIEFGRLPPKFADDKSRLLSSIIAERRAIRERVVSRVLDELQVLLIVEGFDELVLLKDRQQTILDLGVLALGLDRARILMTSRTGDFTYNIDNTVQYEVAPLTAKQIATFSKKWLKDASKAKRFLDSIETSPFKDTAIRPLTLAHLCTLYDRIGTIPEKPKSVYYKIIYLLLEEWDQQRSVIRESRYAKFDVRRKFEFLCQLAYDLTVSLHRSLFSREELIDVYHNIHRDFGLPVGEAERVVNELESHTGLFLKSGYQDFEFAHKSLQEYLSAEYLVRLPSIPPAKVLLTIPNELAIAVTASSKPSEYFNELVFHRMAGKGLPNDFMSSFLNRLFLEKPDFDINVRLGLAVVVLASLHWENEVQRDAPSSPSDVLSYINKLMDLALEKTSLDVIRTHYDNVGSANIGDWAHLHRLRRRIVKPSDALPNLPEFLYVTGSTYRILTA